MDMNDKQYQELQEAGWRRGLTPDETAALSAWLADPEKREALREDAALTRLLGAMPAPVASSNFTARVLRAVPASASARENWRDWFHLSAWLPEGRWARVAVCSLMVGAGALSFHQTEMSRRIRLAHELAGVSRVAGLPPMEWLKN